jgi:hypothetical protein
MPPTRTPETEQSYRVRADQLISAAKAAAGLVQSPVAFARALLDRRAQLAPSSWRQNRAAVVFRMNEAATTHPEQAAQLASAIAILQNATPVKRDRQETLRTSQQKQKHVEDCEFERVSHAILATSCPNAKALVDCRVATALAGARLSEWPTAKFGRCRVDGFAWELTIVNGKNTNGRAHGHIRTLRWTLLSDDHVAQITAWIATAKEAESEGRYGTLLDTLRALMKRVTERLFPRRRKWPKLSSGRHMAAARWKHHYLALAKNEEEKLPGLAIVAALMGHGSDETATHHYARARKGGIFPIPTAEPSEVARIRRVYAMPFQAVKGHRPAL